MGMKGRRAGKEERALLCQELLGCTLFNPTDKEHCLLQQFIGVKKEHCGTLRLSCLSC